MRRDARFHPPRLVPKPTGGHRRKGLCRSRTRVVTRPRSATAVRFHQAETSAARASRRARRPPRRHAHRGPRPESGRPGARSLATTTRACPPRTARTVPSERPPCRGARSQSRQADAARRSRAPARPSAPRQSARSAQSGRSPPNFRRPRRVLAGAQHPRECPRRSCAGSLEPQPEARERARASFWC